MNSLDVNTSMRIHEVIKPSKPLTPDQARLKALKDQAKRSQAAVKVERARQRQRAAQYAMVQAIRPFTTESIDLIAEASGLLTFIAKVKISSSDRTLTCATEIKAGSAAQARAMLAVLYGRNSILVLVNSRL